MTKFQTNNKKKEKEKGAPAAAAAASATAAAMAAADAAAPTPSVLEVRGGSRSPPGEDLTQGGGGLGRTAEEQDEQGAYGELPHQGGHTR